MELMVWLESDEIHDMTGSKARKEKKKANMVLQPTSTSPFSLPRPISPCKAHERQVTLVTFSVGARGKTVLPRKDSLLSKSYHLNPLKST